MRVPNAEVETEETVADLTKFVNLTALLSEMNDERWNKLIKPLIHEHGEGAARRALACPRTQDGAFESVYWRGGQDMAKRILNVFDHLRDRARAEIEVARKTRPV